MIMDWWQAHRIELLFSLALIGLFLLVVITIGIAHLLHKLVSKVWRKPK